MQLNRKLSILTSILLVSSVAVAEDYISVQYVHYNEDSGRTTIAKPAIEFNKNFGTDYTLNVNFLTDTISGASPTFYDASSGASAYSRGSTTTSNVTYGDINYSENRKAGGISLTTRFQNRDELTVGFNYSQEKSDESVSEKGDFKSMEASAEYLLWIGQSKNRSISIGASYQANEISLRCLVNDQCDTSSGASEETKDLNVIGSEIAFTQVVNKNSLYTASFFYSREDGYLSNPYMNIIRNYNTNPLVTSEKKPDLRTSYGITFKYLIALNDNISLNSRYRYYMDDWKISSHTVSSDLFFEYGKKWTFGIGHRYYVQSEAEFYNGKRDFFTDQEYASSDRRLSNFDSINYKLSADYKLTRSIGLSTGINYYSQMDYFDATYYSAGIKYRF